MSEIYSQSKRVTTFRDGIEFGPGRARTITTAATSNDGESVTISRHFAMDDGSEDHSQLTITYAELVAIADAMAQQRAAAR